VSLVGKWFRTSAVFVLFAAINLACVLPYYLSSRPALISGGRVLRALSINVNTANTQYDMVRKFIFEQSPDLILLTEVNAGWLKAMEEVHSDYPYRKSESREDNFGIVLYSKLPFTRSETLFLGRAAMPSVVAEIDVEGRKLTIVGTHTLPPIDDVFTDLRNDQLEALASFIASVSGPKILMGDLNTSPWSYYFGKFLSGTNLEDSFRGRGIRPTWPTHQFWMRIPIDFCLVSHEIAISDTRVGNHIGSDHFPVIVDFAMRT
jgi:endonuclease/exonuclease/phosphatase (EEP) superfamily protein YafD